MRLLKHLLFFCIVIAHTGCIKYPDKTPIIKPIASKALKVTQAYFNKEGPPVFTEKQMHAIFKKAGCIEIHTTKIYIAQQRYSCKLDSSITLSIISRQRPNSFPHYTIGLGHSFCYANANLKGLEPYISCHTQRIISLPSH